MPFLKTLTVVTKNVPNVQSVIPDIASPPEEPERYEPTLSIDGNSLTKTLVPVSTTNLTPKQKGDMYEDYIRELYKAKGYDVLPYGKIRGRWDGGRDLICMQARTLYYHSSVQIS
ncbi:MAG: hypothetical protein IJT58_03875 [Synergistaceae bacterium]|nr:hypothetical protein [Synergistaceae bacterium]